MIMYIRDKKPEGKFFCFLYNLIGVDRVKVTGLPVSLTHTV